MKVKMRTPTDYSGVCDDCKKWAKHLFGDDAVNLRKIGEFAQFYGHKATHYELHRLFMIQAVEVWHSLPTYLNIKE
jgi:hypothetical protein